MSANITIVPVNVKVNKRKKFKGNTFKVIVGVVLGATITLSSVAVVQAYTKHKDEQRDQSIVNYYQEDSVESNIVNYLNLSKQLYDLDLDKYNIDNSLFDKQNISNTLKTPKQIEDLINKCKSMDNSISAKDITKQYENIDTVLNLRKQEKLVNQYIYNTGYDVANENITKATKQYAGEVFGIGDNENITFKYNDFNPENTTVSIKYNNSNYNIDRVFMKEEEKQIMNGVSAMVKTNTDYDNDILDNDKYSKLRNEVIKKALEQSIILNNNTDNEDLFNENIAKKMK